MASVGCRQGCNEGGVRVESYRSPSPLADIPGREKTCHDGGTGNSGAALSENRNRPAGDELGLDAFIAVRSGQAYHGIPDRGL